ncbi:hypothetical protein M440DRAFT_1152095 [Trichoderma longibrachiatum ATCC 18648]|uniref:Uncharacterized protein n=1 Tax=Trichoderma longibrachiatum ATCC 18648 TaxID=983965 RepID=A0A2T4BPS9_TRILO|nr:hypothetical protein M440DRAFT_1152095 [Trichoderma longibrachiatum ATCC 18648]
MAIVAASTSSTAQLVVSGYDMRTHAAAEPGKSCAMDAPRVATRSCMSLCHELLDVSGSAMRTVVAGVGSGRAGVRPARKDDGLTRSILCSKQSTLLCKRHSRGRLTRQRRASENGNRDAGTGGSVAECISPHPARNKVRHATAGCDSERDRPSINDSASQPRRRISCLSGVPLAPLPQSPGRANEKTNGWIRCSKGRCELCEAIRAEASSRSSSSCQTADSRRRRCECCGQQGGRDWP